MNTARNSFGVARLANGNIFVAGGKNLNTFLSGAEEYSISNGTWTVRPSMSNARSGFSLTFLAATGKVLAVAGTGVNGPMTVCELYTP